MEYYRITDSEDGEPVYLPAVVPKKEEIEVNSEEVCEGVLTTVGIGSLVYLTYKVIRLLPSCTPVTFWTLPLNLVAP